MTWFIKAQGHHTSSDWKKEEFDLLRRLVEAFENNADNHTSVFEFTGNHVSAKSLTEAKELLAAQAV